MKSIFLDTGFIIALELKNDQYHKVANKLWVNLLKKHRFFITTSYIFDEIVTFFNSCGHHSNAVKIGNILLNSPSIQFIQVDEILFNEGWKFFQKHSDKTYSLTDCISFAIMKKEKINSALTFDKHFTQAGFVKLPK